MLAGYGKIEITPPLGVELAGYGYYLERRAQRVEDPLFVRALALKAQEDAALLVSCDCLGLSNDITEKVERELASRHGIVPHNLLMVSIHTHTGPAMKYHEGCGQVSPAYTANVADKILAACEEALADRTEVTALKFIMQPLSTPCAYNRACEGNPVDDKARFFRLERQNARPIVIASYACHAVCQGNVPYISADYPGRICQMLEDAGAHSLYVNGACGDIDPIRCPADRRPERLSRFAQTVFAAMETGREDTLPLTLKSGQIEAKLQLQRLSLRDIHRLADQANTVETEPPGGGRVARAWEREMVEAYDADKAEEAFSVRWMCLGGVPVAALPFETYTQTGILIRQALGDARALVLGCAGEMLGYLPTEDDYARHSYASQDAFFLYRRIPTQRGEAERLGRDIGKKLLTAFKEGELHHD